MIQFKSVSKTYQTGRRALKSVSFEIDRPKIVGVIGRNGAGKSTMFKILSGVIQDYEGSCTVDGKAVSVIDSERISYLPEVRGLDGRAQVLEHLTDLVRYKGLRKKDAEQRVLEWLKQFELADAKYKRIDTLSKGNQQKLQFIAAVASKPGLLILDEPFSGLDPITSDLFWDHILAMKEAGSTVIFSTHDLSDKMNHCDYFLFVRDGEIAEQGTLPDIQNKYHAVLELKNDAFKPELVADLIAPEAISRVQDVYTLRLSSPETAKQIHARLGAGFSEFFSVRRLTLNEIFREIHTGTQHVSG